VFAHFFLRPAVMSLEVPERVRLMHEVLRRFFNAVSVAVLLTLAIGLWMIGRVSKQSVQSGAGGGVSAFLLVLISLVIGKAQSTVAFVVLNEGCTELPLHKNSDLHLSQTI